MLFEEKYQKLQEIIEEDTKNDIVIAFSGGVDSSVLLKTTVAHAKKHGTKVYAITANTELHPMNDLAVAKKVAKEMGADHKVLQINELADADITENPVDRCYRCKKFLFTGIQNMAKELGAAIIYDGTNTDDLKVYRPGLKALEELGVKSPLRLAEFSKEDVRKLAAKEQISVASRPSAPCLATRFPYGTTLTLEDMEHVDKGENFLKKYDLYNVRIRVQGDTARIEVDTKYFDKIMENREEIVDYLKGLGYSYIALDLEGFRSGSMDIHVQKDKGE
ncbi:MAG: ATP-dependent sacrificial sulfur transferase LarE [Roseburia sp.]|uniref:ATP-dependent sacrificial sulfur transferase LarE n=1 Tax=Roseburia sp. 831b TaxID=1261635 RepID=UPI0009524C83|nr:ATP-dependent sacrificial sulfur transferase LarE [Roseburia sp. 831b]MCI5919777.1 ATP-dependent sacrificial sulfur transferase LarE [Roseburia sp.]MDY5884533.1 ATP-dependent sacrificial sulfur transferase LarE [Roseburia sp.]WVK74617.1 ATP-dependent sacrificial sulfur transferase LarE [Roseburia sp. 831b]